MKRKVATLLILALSTTLLLGGCGGSSGASEISRETSNGGISIGIKKADTLSECLNKEKIIAYKVESVDKAEIPDNIYFFADGKVTIIPGEEFGLTMGDFAKMEDTEIWSTYETVRETYIENYKNQKVSKYIDTKLDSLANAERNLKVFQTGVEESSGDGWILLVDYCRSYSNSEKEKALINETVEMYVHDEITSQECEAFLRNKADSILSELNANIAQLQAEIDAVSTSQCATPFCDISFQFVIETDSSGNNVQSEMMVYPTLQYFIGDDDILSKSYSYDKLDFVLGRTRQADIYDTTYNCIALKNSGSFLTREVMDIDTFDSKNVLIDLTSSEMNELFKDEVASRYE